MTSVSTIKDSMEFATENLNYCPVCQSKNVAKWCEGRDRLYEISSQIFTYSYCQDCTAVFLSTRAKESEIYKFYPDDYCAYETSKVMANTSPVTNPSSNNKKPVTYIFPNGFADKLKAIYNPSEEKKNPLLLDFGCGAGKFLTKAKKMGWQTTGIDFSPLAIEKVVNNSHQGFVVSDAAWDNIENESIDFIRMNHVLEHLYHPITVLENLKAKMKSGATFHISVPNPYSISAKIFGSRWFSLDCPRHIVLYSPQLLEKILQDLGFREFYILHEVVTKDFARSLVYLFNDYGWGNRDHVDKALHWKSLNYTLHLPARLAAYWGVSDRFHIFMKK
jgi:SAM-dependent methyltransferase